MSAYLQCHRQIDYLVDVAKRWDISWYAARAMDIDHDELGSILVTEQLASVSHAYPADTLDELPGCLEPRCRDEYRHQTGAVALLGIRAEGVLMAVKGYQYQSCEHPGWEGSEAKIITDTLKEWAISKIVDREPELMRFYEITTGQLDKLKTRGR